MDGDDFARGSDEEAVIFREQDLVAGALIRQPLAYVTDQQPYLCLSRANV